MFDFFIKYKKSVALFNPYHGKITYQEILNDTGNFGKILDHNTLILIVTIICAATDIGGYTFGKLFKGPKITKFSPNKTYAGMIGGYFLSLISLSIYFQYFKLEFTIEWLFFTLLISSVSQLGDIIISYFKRLSKIKDTGKIIPGHGGLLDRVDGMIFAFPFSYIFLSFNFWNRLLWKKKLQF